MTRIALLRQGMPQAYRLWLYIRPRYFRTSLISSVPRTTFAGLVLIPRPVLNPNRRAHKPKRLPNLFSRKR